MPSFLDDKGLNKFFQAIKAKFDTRYLNGPANSLIEQNKKSFLKVWRGTADEFKQVETKESDTAYLVEGESADTEYAPITHAARHSKDGADPIIPTTIGAVGYDAAQSLTDGQKTQARENIGAAPGGFGLGEELPRSVSTAAEVDAITANSVVRYANNLTNLVDGDSGDCTRYAIVVTYSVNTTDKAQDTYCYGGGAHGDVMLHRGRSGNTWLPWEWVNPPMQLGVEYRTTERYLGKPVYVKLINCGNLPNGTTKEVAHGITNLDFIVGAQAIASNSSSGFNGHTYLPCIYNGSLTDRWTDYLAGVDTKNIRIFCGGGLAGCLVYVTFKYTKTTD